MKKTVCFMSLIVLILAFTLHACKKEEISNRKMPVLSIVDAESLVALEILPQKVSSSNFYKITVDGDLEEVKFVNPDGSDLGEDEAKTSIEVNHIYNVNKDYLVLSGNFSIIDTNDIVQVYDALLVRKNDGAIFDFGELDKRFVRFDEDVFQSDNYGAIYYPVISTTNPDHNTVNKIDVSNPQSLLKSEYLYPGQAMQTFGISQAGDCIYGGVNLTNSYRVRKAAGGVVDLTNGEEDIMGFWIGSIGDIFINTYSSNNTGQSTWNSSRISVLSPNNNFDPIRVWSDSTDQYFPWGLAPGEYYRHYKIRKPNSIVFVGMDSDNNSWEFFENTSTVTSINMPDYNGKNVSSICYSDNYYYLANGSSLFKVSLSDHTYQDLFVTVQYDVYAMNVSSNDVLQFSGMRFSDGKKVFCEISANGTITTLDEEMDLEATALFRLN